MRLALTYILFAWLISAMAEHPVWDGTWKLDFEHSQITGDTFSYSRTRGGMWKVSNGGAVNIIFSADGRRYRSFSKHDTMTAHMDGPRAWIIRRQHDGREWEILHEGLTGDGQGLVDQDITTEPDGSKSEVVTTYQRVEGVPGDGFVGKWKSVKITGNHSNGGVFLNTYILRSTGANEMSWQVPSEGIAFAGKSDGSRIYLAGHDGPFVQIKRISDHQLMVSISRDGKIERVNQMTLATDNKTFTLKTWDPAKLSETRIGVYLRQP